MAKRNGFTRRQFLEAAARTAGTGVLAASGFSSLARRSWARDPAMGERALIHIEASGGWDPFWFHQGLLSRHVPSSAFSDESAAKAELERNRLFTERHSESQAVSHPNYTDRWFGPGAAAGIIPTDLWRDDILVWRGMTATGGHGIGNMINNHGSSSTYATSYAGLVADAIGRIQRRHLHFVQIAAGPGSVFSKPGLMGGLAVPIHISTAPVKSGSIYRTDQMWKSITSPSPNEPASRRDAINAAVTKASTQIKDSLTLPGSKAAYSSFIQSFSGTGEITKLQAQAADLDAIKARYVQKIKSVFAGAASSEPLKSHILSTGQIASIASWNPESTTSAFHGQVDRVAFNFALAEFLITRKLSSVVEVDALNFDAHNNNDLQTVHMLVTYACYGELLRALKKQYPTNFLSTTTVSLSCEFDRQAGMWAIDPSLAEHPGTDHGQTTSILLAGCGVQGGRVVGDCKSTPAGHADGRYGSDFSSQGYLHGLPIDLSTGNPSASGTLVSNKWIFPTILKIFGLAPPPNQISDGQVLPCVLKG